MNKKPQKRGRPFKPAETKMSTRVAIKMTQAELEELQAAIGPGLRTWLRELALRTVRRKKSK